jgi:hypothetical protein
MANKYKTYFLSPDWDFPVGSIQLGSIISDRSFPQRYLAKHDPVAFGIEVYPSVKENFTDTIDESKTNKYGLWAQFLQIFGLGAEASVSFSKGTIEKYSFVLMKTEFFLPSKDFATAAAKITAVADFLEQTDYEEPVYIITGIKTVAGASVTTVAKKGRGLHLKAGFDGTSSGVPVTVGPEADHKKAEEERASFKNSSPVVFAYELSEMRLQRGGKDVTLKSHTKGALFGIDGKKTVDLETEVVEGPGKLEDGSEVVPAFDEGGEELCNCVLPLVAGSS